MMNLSSVRTSTVSATNATDLDAELASARKKALLENERAQFVGLKLTASDGKIYAMIIWSG